MRHCVDLVWGLCTVAFLSRCQCPLSQPCVLKLVVYSATKSLVLDKYNYWMNLSNFNPIKTKQNKNYLFEKQFTRIASIVGYWDYCYFVYPRTQKKCIEIKFNYIWIYYFAEFIERGQKEDCYVSFVWCNKRIELKGFDQVFSIVAMVD